MKTLINMIGLVVKRVAPRALEDVQPASLQLSVDSPKQNNNISFGGSVSELSAGAVIHPEGLSSKAEEFFVARLAAATEANAEHVTNGVGELATLSVIHSEETQARQSYRTDFIRY